jgi:SAM-dependent methyltransferase
MTERPEYDRFTDMSQERGPLGEAFARQALLTAGPWLPKPPKDLDVLDVGSGYGHTALALAGSCRSVVGLEPATELHRAAIGLAEDVPNLTFTLGVIENLDAHEAFDLIILDNVLEHIPNQKSALTKVSAALRPGGVLFLLVPNKAWPIEAHYHLPFLSWLPLKWANRYLRASRRGTDYADASYAPTYGSLARLFAALPELAWQCVLPGDPQATVLGAGSRVPLHYKMGMAALKRLPRLWTISKALLVIAVKETSR